MKIVFFGTTNLALPVLEALRGQHEILAVVTTPDAKAGRKQETQESPVSALAQDLKLTLVKPENLKNNPDIFKLLQGLNPDIFVVVAYGKILPKEILDLPKHGALNFHPSALPKYRGASPIRTAILNGDEQTAVTFILLDEQTDHGPILTQQVVKIEPDDNNFTLENKLAKAAASIINQVIADYTSSKLTPLPQDEASASHTKIITKEDGKVDWQKSAQEIYNQFRAFYLWPGIWTTWKGQTLKIVDCVVIPEDSGNQPGQVLDNGVVGCGGSTFLKINRLQLAGKNEVSITEFLNGYRDFVGSRLGE